MAFTVRPVTRLVVNKATASVTLNVGVAQNQIPVWWSAIPTLVVYQGVATSIDLRTYCSDADLDVLQFSITAGVLPAGLSLSSAGVVSGTTSDPEGALNVTVLAADGKGGEASKQITFEVTAYSADVAPVWAAQSSSISIPESSTDPVQINVAPPAGYPQTHPMRLSVVGGALPAGVTLDDANRRLLPDGTQATGTTSITLRAENPLSATSRWRKVSLPAATNPFTSWDGTNRGGAKHVWLTWHPDLRRVYSYGGDYGHGIQGQPPSGTTLATPGSAGSAVEGTGMKYVFGDSLRMDMYSMDPYAMDAASFAGPEAWRLEHPYFVRDLGGGVPEDRPTRPDQASLVWDASRGKFWALYSVLRSEFIHQCLPDGTPNRWAMGNAQTNNPATMQQDGNGVWSANPGGSFSPDGTYSWVPDPAGGAGTWTKESTARIRYILGQGTSYNGDELITGAGDERIGQWNIVPSKDKIFCFGNGRLFALDLPTLTYEHWPSFQRSGSTYWNMSASYMAVIDEWIYGVAWTNHPSFGRQSLLVGFNTANLGANGTSCNQADFRFIQLPWSLAPNYEWENSGSSGGYGKLQEHAGVVTIDRKIVVACSYTGVINKVGETRVAVFDHDAQVFDAIENCPYTQVYASSWVALPDTGEIMLTNTTAAAPYAADEAIFYRVRS